MKTPPLPPLPPLMLAAAVAAVLAAAGRPPEVPFQKHVLDLGANETCTLADVNGDQRVDIVSGENWFEAPGWTKHKFRELPFTNNYIDNFSDLALDVNGDGRADIISVAWFSRRIAWFENPGKPAVTWKEHPVESGFPNEFAFLVDLDNDGKAQELLPQFGNPKAPLSWYEAKNGKLVRHMISGRSYGHGIGAGDVNGDGRADVLTPQGWLEAPPDPRSGDWKHHPDWSETKGLGFLHVHDVNGDGRNDVVTSYAHDYGVFWMEQGADAKWTRRMIDESWSQAHALTLVDLNGDGRKDILTGKRYMAHNGRDPGEREPLGIYWYEHVEGADGKKLEWVRHVIDYAGRAGGGMQIPVADLDGDGDLDFAVGGKSGVFLFENLSKRKGKSK
ncbi:MAG: VCBS repeat-containing protein [Acidobacteria bacterium]|nr:VCBS repeat-containing protein [Acidobacteriota bacterium]